VLGVLAVCEPVTQREKTHSKHNKRDVKQSARVPSRQPVKPEGAETKKNWTCAFSEALANDRGKSRREKSTYLHPASASTADATAKERPEHVTPSNTKATPVRSSWKARLPVGPSPNYKCRNAEESTPGSNGFCHDSTTKPKKQVSRHPRQQKARVEQPLTRQTMGKTYVADAARGI